MSRLVLELESVLLKLLDEHRKLLRHVVEHERAIQEMDLNGMDVASSAQQAVRLRVMSLNTQRKSIALQLARSMKIEPGPEGLTVARLAELYPPRRAQLTQIRDDLSAVASEIAKHTKVSGKVAGAMLGHLNLSVRLLARAVERSGLYTRNGIARLSPRIGAMEAIG